MERLKEKYTFRWRFRVKWSSNFEIELNIIKILLAYVSLYLIFILFLRSFFFYQMQ